MNHKTKIIKTCHDTLPTNDTIQFLAHYFDTTTAHAMGMYKRYLRSIGYTFYIDRNFDLNLQTIAPYKTTYKHTHHHPEVSL